MEIYWGMIKETSYTTAVETPPNSIQLKRDYVESNFSCLNQPEFNRMIGLESRTQSDTIKMA